MEQDAEVLVLLEHAFANCRGEKNRDLLLV